MRCTQIIGLTDEALEFLRLNTKPNEIETCPTCGHKKTIKEFRRIYDAETGVMHGMFDDGPELWEYDLLDGFTVREIVQASLWSSGPCIFLCLENERGKKLFEWSKKEIRNC
jgi:hypothetical protein